MGLLLDERRKSKKIHEIKARKHITLMLIPDPTKSAKVIKIPKLPILICCIVITALVISGAGYVIDLRQQVIASRLNVISNTASINVKESLIVELERKNKDHYAKLQQLETLALDLDGKVKELETYKQEMNSKLSSTDSAPRPQQSEEAVVKEATTMETFTPGMNPEVKKVSNQPTKTFDTELNKISTSLEATLNTANDSIEDYQLLNKKVDILIPAWEARPTGSPLKSTVVNDSYGWRSDPINGKTEFHSGIDLKAKNESVYSTGKGKVITAEYESGYGYTIVIDHGYGYKTLYAHNAQLLVEVGDTVSKGEKIAISGASGRVTGAHLHYEVILNGETKDPINYIY